MNIPQAGRLALKNLVAAIRAVVAAPQFKEAQQAVAWSMQNRPLVMAIAMMREEATKAEELFQLNTEETLSVKRFQFVPADLPADAFDYQHMMAQGLSKEEAKRTVQRNKDTKVYLSDTYQVNRLDQACDNFGFDMTWLSIKRIDKEAFHDWRELQGIKNAILGPEREAVELYPRETRCVDAANQYHLWALPEGQEWPFGFLDRMVTDQKVMDNTKQRPFNEAEAANDNTTG